MSTRLPEKGLWHVSDRRDGIELPFDLIKLDLRGKGSGTVRARNLETRLRKLRITGPDRFVAAYDIRGHRGEVAGVCRPDGSLSLSLRRMGSGCASFVDPLRLTAVREPAGQDLGAPLEAGFGLDLWHTTAPWLEPAQTSFFARAS